MKEKIRLSQLALDIFCEMGEKFGFPQEEQVEDWRERLRTKAKTVAEEMEFSEEQCQKVADIAEKFFEIWIRNSEIWKVKGINAELDFGITE